MTKAEDEKIGNLTVTIDYMRLAQDIRAAIHFLNQIKDKLDVAAIEKGIKERERRNIERRKQPRKELNRTNTGSW